MNNELKAGKIIPDNNNVKKKKQTDKQLLNFSRKLRCILFRTRNKYDDNKYIPSIQHRTDKSGNIAKHVANTILLTWKNINSNKKRTEMKTGSKYHVTHHKYNVGREQEQNARIE